MRILPLCLLCISTNSLFLAEEKRQAGASKTSQAKPKQAVQSWTSGPITGYLDQDLTLPANVDMLSYLKDVKASS